jgi:hypothetical protein
MAQHQDDMRNSIQCLAPVLELASKTHQHVFHNTKPEPLLVPKTVRKAPPERPRHSASTTQVNVFKKRTQTFNQLRNTLLTLSKVNHKAADEVASNAHQLSDACDDCSGPRVPVPATAAAAAAAPTAR